MPLDQNNHDNHLSSDESDEEDKIYSSDEEFDPDILEAAQIQQKFDAFKGALVVEPRLEDDSVYSDEDIELGVSEAEKIQQECDNNPMLKAEAVHIPDQALENLRRSMSESALNGYASRANTYWSTKGMLGDMHPLEWSQYGSQENFLTSLLSYTAMAQVVSFELRPAIVKEMVQEALQWEEKKENNPEGKWQQFMQEKMNQEKEQGKSHSF